MTKLAKVLDLGSRFCGFDSHWGHQMTKYNVKWKTHRPCIRCKKIKHFSYFYKRSDIDRPKSFCKECEKSNRKKRYSQNKDKDKQSSKKWGIKNRSRKLDLARSSWLKTRFGITVDDYDKMLAEQSGVCAICSRPERITGRKNLAVDHCHKTKKIRGLLCGHCNTALGKFDDSIHLLEKAIMYLRNNDGR